MDRTEHAQPTRPTADPLAHSVTAPADRRADDSEAAARLTEQLVAAQERLAELGARVRRLEARPGGGDAVVVYALLLAYRDEQRAANTALAAWRRWHADRGTDREARDRDQPAPTVTPEAAPAPPGAGLRFARWLYEQGRLSG